MNNHFVAYVDGSRHFRSNSSGWAFVVYQNGKVIHQNFGEVPIVFEHQYEQYAFSQLMKLVMEENITSIQIYTDALNLKNSIDKIGDWKPEVLKYEPNIILKDINLKIDWISTKNNGVADKLSRKYLEKYFLEEKKVFKENFKNGIVNGNVKHPKINYFHDSRMLHSVTSNARMKERNFLNAVKHESVIIEVGEFKNIEKEIIKIIRVLKMNNQKLEIVEVQEAQENYLFQMLDLAEKWLDFNKRVLLCLSLDDGNFEELACLKVSKQNEDFKKRLEILLESLIEFVLHDKLILKENSVRLLKMRKKNIPNMEVKIKNIKDKFRENNDDALLGKLLKLEFGNFKRIHNRQPEDSEKEKIVNHIREDLCINFTPF